MITESVRFLRDYQLKLSLFDIKSGTASYMACPLVAKSGRATTRPAQ